MPILESKNQKYNVQEADVDKFLASHPDAAYLEQKDGKTYRIQPKDYAKWQQTNGVTQTPQSGDFTVTEQQLNAMPQGHSSEAGNVESQHPAAPTPKPSAPSTYKTKSVLDMDYQPRDYFGEVLSNNLKRSINNALQQQAIDDYHNEVFTQYHMNPSWTPEKAKEWRTQTIEQTGVDPMLEVPESYKEASKKVWGKEGSEDAILSAWMNEKSERRKKYLEEDKILSLVNPESKFRQGVQAIYERARNRGSEIAEHGHDMFFKGIVTPGSAYGASQAYAGWLAEQPSTQAVKAIDKANEIIEAYKNHQADEWFIEGAGKGFRDAMLDIDNWTGIYMVAEASNLHKIADKMEAGEQLTQDEQDFLDAQAYKLAVEATLANDLGWGYGSGMATGMSVPFILQMLASPVNKLTIDKGFEVVAKTALARWGKTALKWAVKRGPVKKLAAKTVLGRTVGEGAKQVLKGTTKAVVGGVAQNALYNSDRTIADALSRNLGTQMVTDRANERFGTMIEGKEGEDMLTAGTKAIIAGSAEHATEYLGTFVLDPLGKTIGAAIPNPFRGLKTTPFISAIKSHKAVKALDHLMKMPGSQFFKSVAGKAQWNGLFSEYLEEVINGGASVLIGDLEAEDWLSFEHNAETLLGLSWMSGFFSVVNGVSRTKAYAKAYNALNVADRTAKHYYQANPQAWEDLKAQIDNCETYEEISALQKQAIEQLKSQGRGQVGEDQIKMVDLYFRAHAAMNGLQAADMAGQEEQTKEGEVLDQATGEGITASDPEAQKDIVAQLDQAQTQLETMLGGQSADAWIARFGETPEQQLQGIMASTMDDATKSAAQTYMTSKSRYDGVREQHEAEIEAMVKQEMQRFEETVNKGMGRYISVTIDDGTDKGRKGSVTVGNPEVDKVVEVRWEDGTTEQIGKGKIRSIDVNEDAITMREAMQNDLERNAIAEAARMMDATHIVTAAETPMAVGQAVVVDGAPGVVEGIDAATGAYTVNLGESSVSVAPAQVMDAESYNAVQERQQRAADAVKHSITPQESTSTTETAPVAESPQVQEQPKSELETLLEEYLDESVPMEDRQSIVANNVNDAQAAAQAAQQKVNELTANKPNGSQFRNLQELKNAQAQWQQDMAQAQQELQQAQEQEAMWNEVSAGLANQQQQAVARAQAQQTAQEHNASIDLKDIAEQTGYKEKELQKLMDWANKLGVKINFAHYTTTTGDDTGALTNADARTQNRAITLNMAEMSKGRAVNWVMGHELTHQVKADGNQKNWEAYVNTIVNAIGEDAFKIRLAETTMLYRQAGAYKNLSNEEFRNAMIEEVCADIAGYVFLDGKNIDKVMGVPQSLTSKIWDTVKGWFGKDTPQSVNDAINAWGQLAGQTQDVQMPQEGIDYFMGVEQAAQQEQTPQQEQGKFSLTAEEQSIIDTAKSNGTYMQAPNGQPTKLTEKQWAQVRTKAFKEWFGDWENDPENASKVVDENGEPMVVYHSGNSGITAFSRAFDKTGIGRQFWGKGFYFGTIKSKDEWARRYKEKTGNEATQYATFLNLKNPKIGALGKADTNFDGAILPSQKTTEGMTEPIYIATNPTQIKSATDNVGSFDAENADIRYSITESEVASHIYNMVGTKDWMKFLQTGPLNVRKPGYGVIDTDRLDEYREYYDALVTEAENYKKALGYVMQEATPASKRYVQEVIDGVDKIVDDYRRLAEGDNSVLSIENNARFSIAENVSDEVGEQLAETENATRFSIVVDPQLIAELEASPKRKGYRNVVQREDGLFEVPMGNSLRGNGTTVENTPFAMGQWEQSEEHPELVYGDNKITLVKPDGKTVVDVNYNPYIHNRLNTLNAQFKQAWERPDLVYVETEVPVTDLEGGYVAEHAHLSTGIHQWSNGALMLSRYDKPVRIVPWDEVAIPWIEKYKKSGVHFDIVPPALRPILAEAGVEIKEPHKGMGENCIKAYEQWKAEQEVKKHSISLSNIKSNTGAYLY